MKIITANAAYLQKYYYGILLKSTLITKVGIPISICDVVNKKELGKLDNKDFIKFTKDEEINFLNQADWIPNFNDYVEKTSDEIRDEIASLDNEGDELNYWFQSLSADERQVVYEYGSTKAKMLMYRKESLNDILSFKEKNIFPMIEQNRLIKRLGILLKNKKIDRKNKSEY